MNVKSTLRLLKSSVFVSISGAFRVHIGGLFVGLSPGVATYMGAVLIVYSTYTFDRALGGDEDEINRGFDSASKRWALLVGLLCFLAGFAIFAGMGLPLVALFPFTVGYMYTQGFSLRGRQFRLKGGWGRRTSWSH
ncbi:MAG: hypothetical protein MAG715_01340 [Methanonatronarchaeales archaeon]|nr:hypothetical protein [Methanonatronarchaeales archaeon]